MTHPLEEVVPLDPLDPLLEPELLLEELEEPPLEPELPLELELPLLLFHTGYLPLPKPRNMPKIGAGPS